MGIFSKKSESELSASAHITVVFGPTMIKHMQELGKQFTLNEQVLTTVEFPGELIKEIDECIQNHRASSRVMFDEQLQFLEVAGESYRQDTLKALHEKVSDGWMSGFLMPEPFNPHDPNAVAVIAITNVEEDATTKEITADVVHIGYLANEQAAEVSRKLILMLENDAYVPVVCKLAGGTPAMPLIGVVARAKTREIVFG